MRILITGAKGMLAKAVIDQFKDNNELILTDVSELDITDENNTNEFITRIKPEYIINCAAYTAVDKAEEDIELAKKVNSIGPKNLAIAAKKNDAILIHISTDYVFNGELDISKSYIEDDEIAPVTVYGKTKAEGEKNIIENCDKYYILRTAWLYGDGNNFVRTMIKLGKEKEEINVVSDQHGSPTYTVDLASIISQVIEKKLPYGIYHSTNEGFTTWYDFTKKIYEIANINCKVNPVTSEEFIRPAKRPKNSKMSKSKLLENGVIIPKYENALERYLNIENVIRGELI